MGKRRLPPPAERLPGRIEHRPGPVHPAHHLPEPDPAVLYPAFGAGAGHLGARDPVLQPGLDLLRHGHQHRLHQVPVRAPRQGSEERHPIRAGLRLVAGAFGGGAGGPGDRAGQHPGAALGLCAVCLERHHPFLHPDPRLLPGDEARPDRLPAPGLQPHPRGRLECRSADAGPAHFCDHHVCLGQGPPGLRRRHGRTARHGHGGLCGRSC